MQHLAVLLAKNTRERRNHVNQALAATTTRSDGSKQVTYNNHLLYSFSGDTQAGATKGENIHAFAADWYVVSPVDDTIEVSRWTDALRPWGLTSGRE